MGSNGGSNKYERKKVYKSKKTGVVKYHIEILIPKETYEKFKRIADDLFPDIQRGKFSYAFEYMVDVFWSMHTQRHTKPLNPRTTTREAWNRVISEIEKVYDFAIPKTIPNTQLWLCIMSGLGIKDPRSIRGWILRFLSEGLIKPLNYYDRNLSRLKMDWKILWEIVSIKS